MVSLAYVLVVGDWRRFPRGKQVGSYLGLIPSEASSGKRQQQMGHITKQGNTLLRWLLVEAATTAQRYDPSWHRQYVRLSMTEASRGGQGGHRAQAGGEVVLDVALRAGLWTDDGARFACEAVRVPRWSQ